MNEMALPMSKPRLLAVAVAAALALALMLAFTAMPGAQAPLMAAPPPTPAPIFPKLRRG